MDFDRTPDVHMSNIVQIRLMFRSCALHVKGLGV